MTKQEAGVPNKPLGPCRVRLCAGRAVERGYCRAHALENPAPRQADNRPSAAARGYDSKWRLIRAKFLKHFPQCCHCHVAKATEVDHIKPLNNGGTHEWKNLQPLCKSCHSKKTVRHDGGGWRRRT